MLEAPPTWGDVTVSAVVKYRHKKIEFLFALEKRWFIINPPTFLTILMLSI